jgi:hypothetical protein
MRILARGDAFRELVLALPGMVGKGPGAGS